YRPLRAVIVKRKQEIEGGHRDARDLEARVNEKMAHYQERLQEARHKGSQEKAQIRDAALRDEAGILSAAHEKAATHLKTIKNQVAVEAGKAAQALRAEARDIAGEIAGKVLGRNI
ncbi:MAG TPA: ATP synthase F0 subunit B, partial [Desulfuromonadales bacterium]|nr:ATP synthase F0 subunit B [Desulfuromonadales bacterium]